MNHFSDTLPFDASNDREASHRRELQNTIRGRDEFGIKGTLFKSG